MLHVYRSLSLYDSLNDENRKIRFLVRGRTGRTHFYGSKKAQKYAENVVKIIENFKISQKWHENNRLGQVRAKMILMLFSL